MEFTQNRHEMQSIVEVDEQDLAAWTLEDEWEWNLPADGEEFLNKLRELCKK